MSATRIIRYDPIAAFLVTSLLVAPAWAVSYDPLTAEPWVQAKVEGSVPMVEMIGTSEAWAGSLNEIGSGSAVLDAAAGFMTIESQTNYDWNSIGARTIVEWDYFTIQGITDTATITVHFNIEGNLYTSAKTRYAQLDTALDYESEYGTGSNRPHWSVGDSGTQESGLLDIAYDVAQIIQVSEAHPYFRLRYWLIGNAAAAGSYATATGQISFDLPDGAWVTSKAGFMAPVPEPGTWTLLLAGLGLLGWQARRKA